MIDEYTAEMAHAAVARGAAWLEKHCPDWFEKIDLSTLRLDSPKVCVLGQTAVCILGAPRDPTNDGYNRIVRRFGHDSETWAERRGFQYSLTDRGDVITHEMLNIAWTEYIRNRLEAVAP